VTDELLFVFNVVTCCHVNNALLTGAGMGLLFAKLWSLFSIEGAVHSARGNTAPAHSMDTVWSFIPDGHRRLAARLWLGLVV